MYCMSRNQSMKCNSFQAVKQIITDNDEIKGVELTDGTEVNAQVVLSNATPKITFLDLLPSVSTEFHLITSLIH